MRRGLSTAVAFAAGFGLAWIVRAATVRPVRPAPRMPRSSDDLVVVCRGLGIHDAYWLRSVLTRSGIECFLPEEHAAGIRPWLVRGDVPLFVRSGDRDRATELLARVAEGRDRESRPMSLEEVSR